MKNKNILKAMCVGAMVGLSPLVFSGCMSSEADLKGLENKIEVYGQQIDVYEQQIAMLQQQINNLASKDLALENAYDTKITNLQTTLTLMQQQLESKDDDLSEQDLVLKQQIETLQQQITTLQAQIEELQQEPETPSEPESLINSEQEAYDFLMKAMVENCFDENGNVRDAKIVKKAQTTGTTEWIDYGVSYVGSLGNGVSYWLTENGDMEELVYTENDELYSFVVNNDSENGFSIKKQKHYSNSFEEQNGGFFDQHLSNGDVTSYRRLENGNYEITFVNIQQTGNSDEEKIEFLKEVMTFVITEDGIVLSFMLEGGYSTLDLKTGVQTEYEIPGITLYEYDYEAEVLDKIYQLISMAQETDVTSNA